MYKVTALSVILAAMGVGSTFANPMDIDFTAMEMAVTKGTAQPYKVGFNINLADFVAEYTCTATLRANTMDNENECIQTGGNEASTLKFQIENPLPKVDNSGLFGPGSRMRKPDIDGNLIMSFTHKSNGQSEPATFNVRMPVEYLEKKGQVGNAYTYTSTRVLKVGEQGDLIAGGNDGSNDAATAAAATIENDSPASFRDPQLNRASVVGGGSALRSTNSRTVVEPAGEAEWDEIEEFLGPLANDNAEAAIASDGIFGPDYDTETATEEENEPVFF